MSRRGRESPGLVASASLAVVAASTVMLLRVLAAAAVVYPPLAPRLAGSLTAMTVATIFAALPLLRAARAEAGAVAELEVHNPFELKSAVLFGLIYSVVVLVATVARATFGDVALYGTAALAGLTDVDAVTLSTAHLAREGLGLNVAAGVILTACLANTLVKLAIAFANGGRPVGLRVARPFGAMAGAGALVVLGQWIW
jgi:uncharacterized membrane protein (DUF4010 family)